MNKKDRLYYKTYMIGNMHAGKTLYWLHWTNIGLIILNLLLKDFIITFILIGLQTVNVCLWIKSRNLYCKAEERRVVSEVLNNNLNEFAAKLNIPVDDMAIKKYLSTSEHYQRDIEMTQEAIKKLYDECI